MNSVPPFEIVDVETARAARGVRLVTAAALPSPWSEGAKGVFHVAGVPARCVRFARDDAALAAWTRAWNVPVVFHDDEPPRTGWAEIVALAARLARTPIVPSDPERRARTFGLLHELAGEDGLGWNCRLVMIDASLSSEGRRGFPLPVARFLAPRYGHAPGCGDAARERVAALLAYFERELAASPTEFLAGERPGALDAYLATFLTPLAGLTAEHCPGMHPGIRVAFDTLREEMGAPLAPALAAHHARMFARHLPFPIPL